MPAHTDIATPEEKTERAALAAPVVGFLDTIGETPYPDSLPGGMMPRGCPICGKTLTGRQRTACSGRCRAALSRRRRIPMEREQLIKIRSALKGMLEEFYALKVEVEKTLGG